MGMSFGVNLCYGYNLGGGGSDTAWNICEAVDGGDPLPTPWWDDFEKPSWIREARPRDKSEYADAANIFLKDTGAEISYELVYEVYSSFVLASYSEQKYGTQSMSIDMEELEQRRIEEGWDEILEGAAEKLGIAPTQKPGWHILVSYF